MNKNNSMRVNPACYVMLYLILLNLSTCIQEEANEKSDDGIPCWRKVAGIGFLLIIIKNLISGFGDILVSWVQRLPLMAKLTIGNNAISVHCDMNAPISFTADYIKFKAFEPGYIY